MAGATLGTLPCRFPARSPSLAEGAQQTTRHDELHHHHRAGRRADGALHDRQPVILGAYHAWLDPATPPG